MRLHFGLLLLTACAGGPDEEGLSDATLEAIDQDLPLTSVLVVQEVAASEAVWLTVRQGACGAPAGAADGEVLLAPGTHADVGVDLGTLLPRPSSGATASRFCVALLGDTADPGVFSSLDAPLLDEDGPIEVELTGSVTPTTPDLRLTWSATGTTDYVLESAEPARFGFATPATEPDLPLTTDFRYAMVWPEGHPFALFGYANDALTESVLLSSTGGGIYDDDASVGRVVAGNTTAFTASASLLTALAADYESVDYVCENHPTDMRGEVTLP